MAKNWSNLIVVLLIFSSAIFIMLWINSPEENWEPWATLISSVAIPIVAFWEKIFGKNNNRALEIEEQKLRLMVKPRIWSNGGGYKGYERSINISVDNRGELCYIDNFEIIEGDEIDLYKWKSSITLEKNGAIRITGTIVGSKHPQDVSFKIRIDYRDQENYKYQSVIQWTGGSTKALETIELPK